MAYTVTDFLGQTLHNDNNSNVKNGRQTKGSNNKDAIIVVVVNGNNPSIQIHANTGWIGNLACTNGFHQRSIRLAHLDVVVRVISHQDIVIGINEEVVGT